ncbi:glutathione S-transferase [Sphingomonas panacisoli]|uniref:Glutathione S-transferase n=1 Tax=Sphingomonas panacisoli TaxID=1813879 RepID=A0A5B8LF16_9SPHN|nr:glutathione S-transferase [Sphingomonas panacisoli]QDZ06459.1 glutathione S-transferase [Sphingomonas panacisoli]
MDPYKLWYWPGIQGRGEFVRLTLEAAGVPYVDCARDQGVDALIKDMKQRGPFEPFAPPYLDVDTMVLAQVGHILTYLADAHDLAPKDVPTLFWTIQLQLTVTDLVKEVHDTHHPVSADDYYEDQKPEAARYAAGFRKNRMPKYLGYFDRAAGAIDGDFVGGDQWSPIDTSLFQIVEGLRYAFPKRMATIERDYPTLIALHDKVADLPGIAAYLKSDRRIPFNEDGIFRHYPELDEA